MSDVRRRPVKQVRLKQLAVEAGLPAQPSQPPVRDDTSQVSFLSETHHKEARDLLLWRRTWDRDYKSSTFSSRSKEPVFAADEVNRAIKSLINDNGSPGLAEALLYIGRESKSSSLLDKMKGKEQKLSWTELLTAAVWKHNYEMIRLLASLGADPVSLNSVLPLAIRDQDLTSTRILLERGADLAEFHTDFTTVVASGNVSLAELLICAPRPPCQRCRTEALIVAAKNGSVQLAGLLAERGVDPDYRDWAAMRVAIHRRQKEMILAILTGSHVASSQSLDQAMKLLYTAAGSDLSFLTKVSEIFLCAGVAGQHTAYVLLEMTKRREVEVVDMFVTYGASVDFMDGGAIQVAINFKDTHLLARLLRAKPTPDTLSRILQATSKLLLQDVKFAKDALSKLLPAGLKGDAVDNFMYQVVVLASKTGPHGQDPILFVDCLELMKMLAEGDHVNVNYKDGSALRAATNLGSLEIIRLLLTQSLSEHSLSAAFWEAIRIPLENPSRLEIMRALLDAGASGSVVDEALCTAVKRGKAGIEEIRLLLRVASVDCGQGAALQSAIGLREPEVLDVLLGGSDSCPTSSTLQHIWEFASRLEDNTYQCEIFRKLIDADPTVAPLNRELVATIARGPDAVATCQLLLERGAKVDANDGLPLVAAVNAQNMAALQLLLDRGFPPKLLPHAFQRVWTLPGAVRPEYAQILLAHGLDQLSVDTGLLAVVSDDSPDMALVALLLDFKASPDFKQGEALAVAVQKGNPELVTTLVNFVVSPENLANALAALFRKANWYTVSGLSILSCLLSRGATGPGIDLAFVQSCINYNSEAYGLLIEFVTSSTALTDALRTLILQDCTWRSAEGLALVEVLVQRGASADLLRSAVVQAAAAFDLSAILLLQTYVHNPITFTIGWDETTLNDDEWLNEMNLPVLEALLAAGARPNLELALIQAVSAARPRRERVQLVELLLRHGANANHNNGQPLRLAAGNGCSELVQIFCQYQPSPEAIQLAFYDVLSGHAHDDPEVALMCVHWLVDCPSAQLDLNSAHDGMDPPLIQVISRYSQSPELVRFLVEAGADVMSTANCPFVLVGSDDWRPVGNARTSEGVPAGMRLIEDVPALLWALMQPGVELTDEVILALIELGANVNFATTHLRFTPLILAAKHDRPAVISKLLFEFSADRNAKDNFQNTALFYAARHGYTQCVTNLVYQATGTNDGSVHEAARNLHWETVQLLLDVGHDPNFCSENHGNRTPLAELCLLAEAENSGLALDNTLRALVGAGADPLKSSGTPAMQPIFMTMANKDPKKMVEKLIQAAMPVPVLQGPDLIFQLDQLCYSPTTYLKKLVLPSLGPLARPRVTSSGSHSSGASVQGNIPYPEEFDVHLADDFTVTTPGSSAVSRAFHVSTTTNVFNEVLTLLIRAGARDRFYHCGHENLAQPVDFVGAPQEIVRRENVRKGELIRLQATSPVVANPGPPVPPRPTQLTHGRDELHIWGSAPNSQAQLQARLGEEKRQVADRRMLADKVNAHLALQHDFIREAQVKRTRARNSQNLDTQALRTEWSAGLASGGSGQTFWRLEEDTASMVKRKTDERLSQLEKAMRGCFPNEEERRVAKRPLRQAVPAAGNGLGARGTRTPNRTPSNGQFQKDFAGVQVAVSELTIGRS